MLTRVALDTGEVMWVCEAALVHLENGKKLDNQKLPPLSPTISEASDADKPKIAQDSNADESDAAKALAEPGSSGFFTDPEGWAKKQAMEKLQRALEPKLRKHGLVWEDVAAALELLDSVADLADATTDPDAFLIKAMHTAGPAGKKIALAKLTPQLEPVLERHGLALVDVTPALELVDSIDELVAAFDNPEQFLQDLVQQAGPVGIHLAAAKLRPTLQPKTDALGLLWADVLPALRLVDSIDELTAATEDPEAFLEKLMHEVGPAAKQMALARLRPTLEPLASKRGLSWQETVSLIDTLSNVNIHQLRAAIADPIPLLEKLQVQPPPDEIGATISTASRNDIDRAIAQQTQHIDQHIDQRLIEQEERIRKMIREEQERRLEENRMHDRTEGSKACAIS